MGEGHEGQNEGMCKYENMTTSAERRAQMDKEGLRTKLPALMNGAGKWIVYLEKPRLASVYQ